VESSSFILPSFLELGAWTTQLILPLFHSFKDPNVAPALALAIVFAAGALCALFLLDVGYIWLQIRRRIRAIRRLKDGDEFVHALPEIEKLMASSRYLRHSWHKFRETLIEPILSDEPAKLVVLNTERPQHYFNMSEAGLRFHVFRAMPNLLVGVGLLLTFFGLVSALFFTTDAIKNASDLAASQGALKDLLYAASFKFYTSIAGLGGSIVLTLVLRFGSSVVESCFDSLAFGLESKLRFVTPESIAFDHYREAQEQTKNLKLFNTEVAISIGRRIEEALAATLPNYLAQAMAPIGKSLDEVASKLTSMNEGAIGEMAGSFVEKLQGAAGQQMQGLAATLGDLRSSIEELNRRTHESGSGLAENLDRSTGEMRAAIAAMTSALNEMSANAARGLEDGRAAMTQQIETAAAALGDIARRVSAILDQTGDRLTAGSEQASANFVKELSTATQNFEAAAQRSASRIEEAVNALTRGIQTETAGLGEQISRAALTAGEESRSKVVDAGTDLAHTLSGISQQLTDSVSRMQDALSGTVREMVNIEHGIAQHVSTIAQLSKATRDTESAMIGTARSMREAGTPIAESSRLIAEASTRIADSTGSAERCIASAQTEIQTVAQLLHRTIESTAQQWRDYEQRFQDVDESLGSVLDRIIQSVQENLEALRSFVENVDEKLSSAVDKLGGGIEELSEFAQTMEQVTGKLNGGNGLHPSR
jgi:methyl-accepting chemotaxis protein